MTEAHISQVPDEAEIFTGARGAQYFFRNGNKVYITYSKRRRITRFKVRRGAFQRFLENQSSGS